MLLLLCNPNGTDYALKALQSECLSIGSGSVRTDSPTTINANPKNLTLNPSDGGGYGHLISLVLGVLVLLDLFINK